jgi:hypothetical protein
MLAQLSSRQLSEWIAWAHIRGMPEARADYRTGQICAMLANIYRDSEKSKVFSPSDFMPPVPEPIEEEGDEAEFDPIATSRAIMALLGKKE